MMLKGLMAAGFVIATAAAGAGGQRSTVDISPSLANPSLVGGDTYAFYCAPCHGKDGKGRGPVAEALKTLPADLTTLAARNGGAFPKDRVRAFVTTGDAGHTCARIHRHAGLGTHVHGASTRATRS